MAPNQCPLACDQREGIRGGTPLACNGKRKGLVSQMKKNENGKRYKSNSPEKQTDAHCTHKEEEPISHCPVLHLTLTLTDPPFLFFRTLTYLTEKKKKQKPQNREASLLSGRPIASPRLPVPSHKSQTTNLKGDRY